MKMAFEQIKLLFQKSQRGYKIDLNFQKFCFWKAKRIFWSKKLFMKLYVLNLKSN